MEQRRLADQIAIGSRIHVLDGVDMLLAAHEVARYRRRRLGRESDRGVLGGHPRIPCGFSVKGSCGIMLHCSVRPVDALDTMGDCHDLLPLFGPPASRKYRRKAAIDWTLTTEALCCNRNSITNSATVKDVRCCT
jgi:hypothetical protein